MRVTTDHNMNSNVIKINFTRSYKKSHMVWFGRSHMVWFIVVTKQNNTAMVPYSLELL